MKRTYFFFLLLLMLASTGQVFAQHIYKGVSYPTAEQANAARQRDNMEAIARNRNTDGSVGNPVAPANPTMSGGLFYKRDYVEGPLKVRKEIRSRYADFLKLKGTGIFTVVPEEKTGTVTRNGKQRYLSPESAYYYFERKVHYKPWADLRLKDGRLETGIQVTSFGHLRAIGNVAIESLTEGDARLRALAAVKLPRTPKELEERRQAMDSSAPFEQGQTYLLRSAVVNASNTLIAFRVVDVTDDGQVVIIWRSFKKMLGN